MLSELVKDLVWPDFKVRAEGSWVVFCRLRRGIFHESNFSYKEVLKICKQKMEHLIRAALMRNHQDNEVNKIFNGI